MKLSPEQIDTILAALRLYQGQLSTGQIRSNTEIVNIASNSGAHALLDECDIDELCEELNFAAEVEVVDDEDDYRDFPEGADDLPEPGDIRETGK